MSEQLRERYFGRTTEELAADCASALDDDADRFSGIVDMGRKGFGLEGTTLVEFGRRCLTSTMARGARPVHMGGEPDRWWTVQPQYGTDPDEIVENVIAEWLAEGGGDPEPTLLWFALPRSYEATKPWMRPRSG